MAEVIFNYEGIITKIQCHITDKMSQIISKFIIKTKEKGDNLFYLYNGNKINKELSFIDQANVLDKNRKKMNIIVNKNEEDIYQTKEILSKDVICPECKESILLNVKNFKINLYGCKNNHQINNLILNNFEESQKIDISKIVCEICHINNKNKTHNNEFYICNTCNKNICPLCKSNHDQNHIIINYNDKNYLCSKHNDSFIKFCKTCYKDICIICENEHINHYIINLNKLLINKNELIKSSEELKNIIDKFKYKISIIKEILDSIINIIERYHKLNNYIINNYNINKRNFHKLQNLNNLKINNEMIIAKLNNIINSNKIFDINNYPIYNFYNNNTELTYFTN